MRRFTYIDSNTGTTRDLGLVIILFVCLTTLGHVALLVHRAFVARIVVAQHWHDVGF